MQSKAPTGYPALKPGQRVRHWWRTMTVVAGFPTPATTLAPESYVLATGRSYYTLTPDRGVRRVTHDHARELIGIARTIGERQLASSIARHLRADAERS